MTTVNLPPYTGNLKPEHLEIVHQIIDHRMRIGLSTERCNRPAAEAAVKNAYRTAGFSEPPIVIWMDSPAGGAYAAAVVHNILQKVPGNGDQLWGQLGDQLRNQLRNQLWEQIWDQLWDQLGDQMGRQLGDQIGSQLRSQVWNQLRDQLGDQMGSQLWGQLGEQLRDQLGEQLREQIRDQIGEQLRPQVWSQLGDQVGDQLRGQLREQLRGQLGGQLWGQVGEQLGDKLRVQVWGQVEGKLGEQLWGQVGRQFRGQLGNQLRGQVGDQIKKQIGRELSPWYEAYWIGLYSAAMDIMALENERLTAFSEAIDSVGWWWPMRGAVILTDRPTTIRMETSSGTRRLHCEDGPSIAYNDGYSMWSWHGITVPQDLIEGTGWSIKRIFAEENVEIRRCAIEKIGWDKFIESADLKLVDTQPDPANFPHSLRLYDVPRAIYGEDVRVVLMTNASPDKDGSRTRLYGETVPASISDAIEAQAWAWGIPREEYQQLQRAT